MIIRSYGFWRRLFWLPEPVYYWLQDRIGGLNGWRPLSYRKTVLTGASPNVERSVKATADAVDAALENRGKGKAA